MVKGLLPLICSALLLVLAGYHPASAQQPTPTPDEYNSDTSKDDILILVNVKAKELRLDVAPNTTVEFPGTRHRSTIWVTQRQNLPEKLEPGVTYRDIGIQLRISSRFADIERIVQEALGEVPITDASTPMELPKVTPAPAPAVVAKAQLKPSTNQRRQRQRRLQR